MTQPIVLIDFDVEDWAWGGFLHSRGGFTKVTMVDIKNLDNKKVLSFLPIDIAMVRVIVSKLTDLMMPAEYRASN